MAIETLAILVVVEMTRTCSWCGGVIGEKCSKCGRMGLAVIGDGLYKCEPCGFTFETGEGGVTDGICDPCGRHAAAVRPEWPPD